MSAFPPLFSNLNSWETRKHIVLQEREIKIVIVMRMKCKLPKIKHTSNLIKLVKQLINDRFLGIADVKI